MRLSLSIFLANIFLLQGINIYYISIFAPIEDIFIVTDDQIYAFSIKLGSEGRLGKHLLVAIRDVGMGRWLLMLEYLNINKRNETPITTHQQTKNLSSFILITCEEVLSDAWIKTFAQYFSAKFQLTYCSKFSLKIWDEYSY